MLLMLCYDRHLVVLQAFPAFSNENWGHVSTA